MYDPLFNDMLFMVTIPVTIIIVAIIYKIIDVYVATKDLCKHQWSRWSDPKTSEAHPYQTRSCNKCNMHEQRLVQ